MSDKFYLWKDQSVSHASIVPFLVEDGKKHPAILVIPGGGYGDVCEYSEGHHIALSFNKLGYHAFVLDYRVAPNRYPAPQQDAIRAVKFIRGNADKWNVEADKIVSCGFSAGGHLAGSIGVLYEKIEALDGDEYDQVDGKVNAMILSYGVLTFGEYTNERTAENLSGGDEKLRNFCSLEKADLSLTPPAFVWATVKDQLVDYRNSMLFADAMMQAGRPCELRIFPYGAHGMLLGLDTLDVVNWMKSAVDFLETQWKMRENEADLMAKYDNLYQWAASKRALGE